MVPLAGVTSRGMVCPCGIPSGIELGIPVGIELLDALGLGPLELGVEKNEG